MIHQAPREILALDLRAFGIDVIRHRRRRRGCKDLRGSAIGGRFALHVLEMTVGFSAQSLTVYQPPAPAVRGGSSRPAIASRRLRNSRTLYTGLFCDS